MGVISGNSGMGFGAAFTLRDNFSSTSDRISRKMSGLSAQTDATARRIEAGTKRMQKGFQQMMVGGVSLAALALPAAAAASFEEAMVEVQKVTDPETAKEMSGAIKGMSETIPMATNELASLTADAARFGIEGTKNIEAFTRTTSKMAIATDMTSDQAGESLAKLATITKTPIQSIENLGSSINELSNTAATSSSEIVNNALRASKGLQSLGVSNTDMMAIAASLNEVAPNAARAGTQMNRLASLMQQPDKAEEMANALNMNVDAFNKMRDNDPTAVLMKLAKAFRDNKEAEQALRSNVSSAAIKALSGLSQNVEGLAKNLNTSAEAFEKNQSLQKEFEAASDTLISKLKLLRNHLFNLGDSIGRALLPGLKLLAGVFMGIFKTIQLIVDNPIGRFFIGLASVVAAAYLTLGAFNTAAGWTNVQLAKMTARFGGTTTAGTLYRAMMHTAKRATQRFAIASRRAGYALRFLTGPVGWIIAAIGALIAVYKGMIDMLQTANPLVNAFGYALAFALGPVGWIVAAITTFNRALNEFKEVMSGASEVQGGFIGFLQRIGGVVQGLRQVWSSWNGEVFEMSEKMASKLEQMGILDLVLNLGTYILRAKQIFIGLYEGFMEGAKEIKKAFKELLVAITPSIDSFDELFGSVTKAQTPLEKFTSIGKTVGKTITKWIAKAIRIFKEFAPAIKASGKLIYQMMKIAIDVIPPVVRAVAKMGTMFGTFIGWIVKAYIWVGKLYYRFYKFLAVGMYEIGKSMVNGLVSGIKALWSGLKSTIDTIKGWVMSIPGASYLAGGDEEEDPGKAQVQPIRRNVRNDPRVQRSSEATGRASRQVRPQINVPRAQGDATAQRPINIRAEMDLDGYPVEARVREIQEEREAAE